MGKLFYFLLIFLFLSAEKISIAQIVTIDPATAGKDDSVTINYNAALGTGGLEGAQKVYIHTGVVTASPTGTNWEYVIGNWGINDGIGEMTKVEGENDLWEITLSPSIREYYGIPSGTEVYRLAMVFRNANGSAEGKGIPGRFCGGEVTANGDIYIDLFGGSFLCISEPEGRFNFLQIGETLNISASAREAADLQVQIGEGGNFTTVATAENATEIAYNFIPDAPGNFMIKVITTSEGVGYEEEVLVNVYEVVTAEKPDHIRQGINYQADPGKVTLCLLAPGKDFVYIVGDFTDWSVSNNFLMHRSVDGELFWLEVEGLTPGQEYVFQYWVNGHIRIGDPYADKVADPWNDEFIPETVYPQLPEYNRREYGIATVLQTSQPDYNWAPSEADWQRPPQEELIIYELLLRDFIGSHNYQDLADTLSYLKRLGVNAIELMPIMEFEGNESWGYNPTYFFAPDKYYGSKNDLKQFVETAHREGFAVILDMVLNHAFGQNAMVQLYWDRQAGRPSEENPWFNSEATHPFNVGYDFNHESPYTQSFVDSVNSYWLSEYHFDGFRFDLSKGFTQNVTTEVGAWSAYDASRISLLTRMNNHIKTVDENAYVILEHFAVQNEENELVNQGMLVWRNLNHNYRNAVAGNPPQNFDGANDLNAVSYMESHDEQRVVYDGLLSGQSYGDYHTRDTLVALNRSKLAAAFFFPLSGPKMLWQFQELGYGIDIDFNGRVGNKPLVWGTESLNYYNDPERQKLYKSYAAIINLVQTYPEVFTYGEVQQFSHENLRGIKIVHPDMDVVIIGNFGLTAGEINPEFSRSGEWYDFFFDEAFTIDNVNDPLPLAPGEFRIYTSIDTFHPEAGLIDIYRPVVKTTPENFSAVDQVRLIFDATAADPDGTSGLVGADKVYMYTGVILDDPNNTEWQYITGTPGVDDGVGEMTKVEEEENKWEITFTPKNYFNVPVEERIYRLAMYFMDAGNTRLGKALGGKPVYLNVSLDSDQKIVSTDPEEFTAETPVKIIFDASLADPAGTAGLINVDMVYMHSGPVTSGATATAWDSEHVKGNWGQDDGVGLMAKVPGTSNLWEIEITPRTYFDVPAGKRIYRIGMVFRNSDGSREGKAPGGQDIFVEVQQDVTWLEQENISGRINLYPNPAEYTMLLDFGHFIHQEFFITLTDLKGTVKYRWHSAGQEIMTLEVNQLPAGLYILKGESQQHKFFKKLLVK
jgi:glycosidase